MIYIRVFFLLLFPIMSYGFYIYPFDDPVYKLKEIQTKNFRIIFSDSSQKKAQELAKFVEEEFYSLTEYYTPFPIKQKIRVIISSDYQEANGFASLFSFPTIHLYVGLAPEISHSHSYTTPNSLHTLFRHELAHILTLSYRKIYKSSVLNAITYNLLPTVVFTSRSFMEGAAIARESDNNYGRYHDPYYYHLARRDILDGNIPSFAQFSGASTEFGSGNKAYTYGGLLNAFLSEANPIADKLYWNQAAKWRLSALAVQDISKKSLKQLWMEFTNFLSIKIPYEQNMDMLLSKRKQRINSLQKINNRLYYYNYQDKSLRYYDLIKNKSYLSIYGNSTWDTISISPDDKYILVSGTSELKKFIIILNKKTLLPVSKVYEGLINGYFTPNSSINNFQFTAINIGSSSPKIIKFDNNQFITLLEGSSLEYFNNPIQVNNNFLYFLHSYNGKKTISRLDYRGNTVSTLTHPSIQFPRFLSKDQDIISFSYAEDSNSFYKRAIIQDDQLLLIQNNIKGEIFDSIIIDNNLIYKSSFSKYDNILVKSLSNLSIITQRAVFQELPDLIEEPVIVQTIIPYKSYKDLIPYMWIPYISLEKAGISTILIDSTGANKIIAGLNINYTKGTPEFNFEWEHNSFPIHSNIFIQNLLLSRNSIFQLNSHMILNTGIRYSYYRRSQLLGSSFCINGSLSWQGRFIGNQEDHPFEWDFLALQQLLGTTTLSWQNYISEGKYGFYRLLQLEFLHQIDYLHPKWYSFEVYFAFSPPVLPIQINIYGIYNTSLISVQGNSALGRGLLPYYKEYAHFEIFNNYSISGSLDILLYSWEIQEGVGFGELYFNRWAFYTGYRAGYFGKNYPYLHSIYLKTEFTFSFLFGTIPINTFIEAIYAITINQWDHNYGLQTSISY